jgi:hypothetical protein
VWQTVPKVMELVAEGGYDTTAEVQAATGLRGSLIQSTTIIVPSDVQGYLMSKLEAAYRPEVSPPLTEGGGVTLVRAGVRDLILAKMNIAGNTFEGTFWLDLSWCHSPHRSPRRSPWHTRLATRLRSPRHSHRHSHRPHAH